MRRSLMALAAACASLGAAVLVPNPVQAAEATAAPSFLHHVQFYRAGPSYDDGRWERRGEWRERQDEARIAEAARREAYRIEAEREQRRAWRHAQREQQYGYGPAYGYGGYQRGW